MIDLGAELAKYGLAFVFANVLVEQAGLPVPAVPAMIAAGALAAYIGWRLVQRRRFLQGLRTARISVAELTVQLADDDPPLVVDVRTPGAVWLDPRRIPGALRLGFEEIEERMETLPRAREVVLYCT